MPDTISLIDVIRPGLHTLTVLDDITKIRIAPKTLRFAADVAWTSDSSAHAPWLKTAISITPGEQIPIKWEFDAGASDVGHQVTARIEFEGNVIYASGPVILKTGKSGLQRATIVIGDEAIAKLFYKLGSRTLTLVVRWDGDSPGQIKRRTYWNVVSPIGVQSFWDWGGPAERHADWKSAYNLPGRFMNATPYTAMATAQVRLVEDDANWHDHIERTNEFFDAFNVPGIVNAGVVVPHSFSVKGKDFEWLEKIGWIKAAGGLYRYFHYRVFIKLSDIYGNDYPEFADINYFNDESDDLRIEVKVSTAKQHYADLAAEFFRAAVAMSVSAFFWPPLAAGAAAAAAASTAFGIKALDPPSPDPNFMEPVELRRPHLPRGDGQTHAIMELIETAMAIVAVDDALVAIEGKILGAEAAEDQNAAGLQRHRYEEMRQFAIRELELLLGIEPQARQEFQELQLRLGQAGFQQIPSDLALTPELHEALALQQVPAETIGALEQSLASGDVGNVAERYDLRQLPTLTAQLMSLLVRLMLRYKPARGQG
jgi:hypothetical protein